MPVSLIEKKKKQQKILPAIYLSFFLTGILVFCSGKPKIATPHEVLRPRGEGGRVGAGFRERGDCCTFWGGGKSFCIGTALGC